MCHGRAPKYRTKGCSRYWRPKFAVRKWLKCCAKTSVRTPGLSADEREHPFVRYTLGPADVNFLEFYVDFLPSTSPGEEKGTFQAITRRFVFLAMMYLMLDLLGFASLYSFGQRIAWHPKESDLCNLQTPYLSTRLDDPRIPRAIDMYTSSTWSYICNVILGQRSLKAKIYPWGRLDYIRNSKTIKGVSVSVMFWKLIWKQFKSVSVISGVQV